MIVVSDTSPINHLALIGQEYLLPQFFGSILIPTAVHDELMDAGAPVELKNLMRQVPDWLRLTGTNPDPAAGVAHLHPGERDVILAALWLKADLILMDEAQGRTVAESLGLTTIGTIGILDRAVRRGIVNGSAVASRLRMTNFRAPPELLALLEGSATPRFTAQPETSSTNAVEGE